MTRKYLTEFALNMVLDKMAVARLSDLDALAKQNYFDEESPCHIYIIGTRPKLSIDKGKFSFNDDFISLTVRAQIKDKFDSAVINIGNTRKSKSIRLETEYPYHVFKLFEDEMMIMNTHVAHIVQRTPMEEFSDHMDIEILYVGQSYGVEGARTAPDRLRSHSTLQNILEEANKNNPDKDILLGLFSFEELLFIGMDGRIELTKEEDEADNKHLYNVLENAGGMSEQQKINFTEAALIRYFQPSYNKMFKDSFPNFAHSTYSECYELDLNSVAVELTTDELHIRFYSTTVERSWHHLIMYKLHSSEERREFFPNNLV